MSEVQLFQSGPKKAQGQNGSRFLLSDLRAAFVKWLGLWARVMGYGLWVRQPKSLFGTNILNNLM